MGKRLVGRPYTRNIELDTKGHPMKHTLATLAGLSLLLTACGQQVQAESATSETAGETEAEASNPTVRVALEVVPAARPYVDPENGRFDYGAARAELGLVEARELRSIWRAALREAQITAN